MPSGSIEQPMNLSGAERNEHIVLGLVPDALESRNCSSKFVVRTFSPKTDQPRMLVNLVN